MTAAASLRAPHPNEAPTCLGCAAPLHRSLVDLGSQPLANNYISVESAGQPEPRYPLHVRVCDSCLLVQVGRIVPPREIFHEGYAYFSSYSDGWLRHCRSYADEMTARFALGPGSRVVEIASNDGYLLQYFLAKGIEVLGIEPAANVAAAARAKGVPTLVDFFGYATAAGLARAGHCADLLAAKNVLAHVPDINDFVAGIATLLKQDGVFTVEFPHLLNLVREVQFDTIYHEHFTYLSLLAVGKVFERHGLSVFDVETLPTHGGSLRLLVSHRGAGFSVSPAVQRVLCEERDAKLDRPEGYAGFAQRVEAIRANFRAFLDDARHSGRRIAAYGAAAKGNTFLNVCAVGADDIAFVVDRNPAKQNRLLPGSHIPVLAPEALSEAKPDFVLILPWNLREEIVAGNAIVKSWGGRFVTAMPQIRVD